jgi:hypothetical protein
MAGEPELKIGEVDDVPVGERRFLDRLAIHERSVLASKVAQPERPVPVEQLGVHPRDRGQTQNKRETGTPANPEGKAVHRDSTWPAVSLTKVLEVPHNRYPPPVKVTGPCGCVAVARRHLRTPEVDLMTGAAPRGRGH